MKMNMVTRFNCVRCPADRLTELANQFSLCNGTNRNFVPDGNCRSQRWDVDTVDKGCLTFLMIAKKADDLVIGVDLYCSPLFVRRSHSVRLSA